MSLVQRETSVLVPPGVTVGGIEEPWRCHDDRCSGQAKGSVREQNGKDEGEGESSFLCRAATASFMAAYKKNHGQSQLPTEKLPMYGERSTLILGQPAKCWTKW